MLQGWGLRLQKEHRLTGCGPAGRGGSIKATLGGADARCGLRAWDTLCSVRPVFDPGAPALLAVAPLTTALHGAVPVPPGWPWHLGILGVQVGQVGPRSGGELASQGRVLAGVGRGAGGQLSGWLFSTRFPVLGAQPWLPSPEPGVTYLLRPAFQFHGRAIAWYSSF